MMRHALDRAGDLVWWLFEAARVVFGVLLLLLALLFAYWTITDNWNFLLVVFLLGWAGASVLRGYDVLN